METVKYMILLYSAALKLRRLESYRKAVTAFSR